MNSNDSMAVSTTITAAVAQAARSGEGAEIARALSCVRPSDLTEFFHHTLDGDGSDLKALTTGLPASPGAASGRIVFSAEEALQAADGDPVILVRSETSPDDVAGMQVAAGILTVRGGLASHAAVVARGWGIPAVVGASEVAINPSERTITIMSTTLCAGDQITVDGSTGAVYPGVLAISATSAPPELHTLLAWADQVARGHVEVRANADNAQDATHARELGAKGIGLCRTEHMFLAKDRLAAMRRFILADDEETEQAALAELESAQVHDFEHLLHAMDGLPVTVRLLDPPLHEFLPDLMELTARQARGELSDQEEVELVAARRLHETNPMIGTRGVRLGIIRTGLYEMQARALCTAAANLFGRGLQPRVEIMIPLVVDAEELRLCRDRLRTLLDEIGHPELGSGVVTIGAMIETPRAALTAADLARHADFFSFGTNDLTQLTYGFSRDDVEAKLIPAYREAGILSTNPFASLDLAGVGQLVRVGCEQARSTDPTIKLGVCGEHAGDPVSVDFLVAQGVDSVSCSPLRVPLARLGVAQALLASGRVAIDDVEFETSYVVEAISQPTDPDHVSVVTEPAEVDPATIDEATVLHTLRIRGFVTPEGLRASLGAVPTELLTRLVERGLVGHMEARDLYSLTPQGRAAQEGLLSSYATDEVRRDLADPYQRFLTLNREFKALCADWQTRDGAANDHSDAAYDQTCIARLVELDQQSAPVAEEMAGGLARMGRYRQRLAEAVSEVQNGQTKRFTGVMCESYHDIWMEWHEDLIVLQGIDRTSEGSF